MYILKKAVLLTNRLNQNERETKLIQIKFQIIMSLKKKGKILQS